MSRPIAYNASGPLSGSIRGGNVNYTVDSGNRDYTTFASKKWVPSADGVAPIVFVTDTYTQGFELNPNLAVPLFYSCNGTGSAAILYTANRIPNSPGNYSDANVALNDLINARGYFILESNDPYQGINADSLAFDVDASKMSSYPQTGTNWRDLSGKGTNGTLTNGPTWNSNGYFAFDGADDYVNFPNDTALNSNSITVSSTFSPATPTQNGFLFEKGYVNTQYALFFEGSVFKLRFMFSTAPYSDFGIFAPSYMTAGRWYNAIVTYDSSVAKMYINGNLVNQATYNASISVNNNGERIGAWYDGSNTGYHFAGSIANTQVYPRALTEAQVKQNYFGAPIVTDGLVFAVDANNIVSYPKSGTAWYNLTGSVGTGTLTNGPTFNINNGGSIRFDGVDDFVNIPYNSSLDITNAITVEAWVKYASQGEIGGVGRTYSVISYKGYPWTWLLEDISGQFNFRISTTSDGDSRLDSNYYHGVERWDHVACTYNGSTQSIYVNGILQNSKSLTGTIITSGTTIELGTYGTGDYSFNGWLANHRVYNRALSASEILQNYQAEQYRFETPAGPVTNGLLLYWDAGNLDSYPGTGTTIYDLSGNGNNGTLYNGVGYNQVNGGVLTFDGIDDYVQNNTLNLAATDCTVIGISRYTSVNTGVYQGGGRVINARNNNWLMGHWDRSAMKYYAQGWVTDSDGTEGMPDTNWHFYHTFNQYSTDSWSFYIDNVLDVSNSNGSEGPNGFSIGQYGNNATEFSKSNFSVLLAYNRILSATEVTQVYNYFKGRFGL